MLADYSRAISQVFDRRFISILIKAIGLTLGLLIGLADLAGVWSLEEVTGKLRHQATVTLEAGKKAHAKMAARTEMLELPQSAPREHPFHFARLFLSHFNFVNYDQRKLFSLLNYKKAATPV